ncbi:MAG: PDDEXK nuclease domain-containing protein [Gammaproteobacteria bacterium]|nr:PDDEXK nuclease domain-containing protein [Gammaproteobacteria bacterium]
MKKLDKTPSSLIPQRTLNNVYADIVKHITQARKNVVKAVNTEQVIVYWHIGRIIVVQEQAGKNRAEYGKALIQNISEKLKQDFGAGFSVSNLKNMRQFYLAYQDRIRQEAPGEFGIAEFDANLSWTHYQLLSKESRVDVRQFYEIEAGKNHWSTPQLEHQMTSFLYERLAASRNKKGVLSLANKGQIIEKPEDALKSPYVLSFLGYKQHHTYSESELETAIINNLQDFLLELGRGFAFVARQKKIYIEGDLFQPDLIFYHTLLKCYVILDIKVSRLKHQDIGQMLMYVNYYDRDVKQADDNPTIGLLLCAEHNETVVKYTLPENNQQIFSRKYQFHLPSIEELQKEVAKEYQAATQCLEKKSKSVKATKKSPVKKKRTKK